MSIQETVAGWPEAGVPYNEDGMYEGEHECCPWSFWKVELAPWLIELLPELWMGKHRVLTITYQEGHDVSESYDIVFIRPDNSRLYLLDITENMGIDGYIELHTPTDALCTVLSRSHICPPDPERPIVAEQGLVFHRGELWPSLVELPSFP